MKISTAFFGHQEIDLDTLITFPEGIPGLDEMKRFKLFSEEGKPTVMWLQSIDDADVVFSVASPAIFNIGYEISLTDQEAAQIELESARDVEVLVILRNSRGMGDEGFEVAGTSKGILANFKGPLLINTKSQLGMQKLLPVTERYTVIREAV